MAKDRPNGLRIERNGWVDGEAPPARPERERPSPSATLSAVARGCVGAETAEGAARAALGPLREDGRVAAAWVGATTANVTTVFGADGVVSDAKAIVQAAAALERSSALEIRPVPSDVAARLSGPGPGAAAAGLAVTFPVVEKRHGWLIATGAWAPGETREVEALVVAAAGLVGLALGRIAAGERARVAQDLLTAAAPPEEARPVETAPAVPANGHASANASRPPPPPPHGNGASAAPRTLLSAAALDGIRAFVDVTPGAKSPKLSDGAAVYSAVAPRDASRWIARLLVAVFDAKRTVRLAIESAGGDPSVRIDADGPLATRANLALASVGDELTAHGGGLRVEATAAAARVTATFPRA